MTVPRSEQRWLASRRADMRLWRRYLMTTPLTHNTDVYDPSELTLITSKKKKETQWAQPIFVLQRRVAAA